MYTFIKVIKKSNNILIKLSHNNSLGILIFLICENLKMGHFRKEKVPK